MLRVHFFSDSEDDKDYRDAVGVDHQEKFTVLRDINGKYIASFENSLIKYIEKLGD